ncbi:hypothetical protein K466DRAFT_606088 [Polyporus arcularius HHB13444]|uniref:LCCL domain-containing protein n=1 Tax=Polyporus arcularius HHB13444 TaxID=1314778 RepID=A0A5C3NQB3_9APHY|nr:hypothetical protein K466DRAFT_606088 [Polyporus arcularius HHB13444]
MAVPAEMTSRDFSGKFVQNKALSEKEQDILKMQGVGWAMRKTISLAVPHLAIKHYTDAAGVEHIEVEQTVPGLRSNSEHRVLDWSQQKVDGPIFGALVTQNRRVQADELEPGWLKDGLCPETFVDGAIVHTLAQSDSQKDRETWRMEQTWGFEHIGGGKRYVRRVYLVGSTGEAVQARLVYDYEGTL